MDLHGTLREFWGYELFRPKQQEIVESILAGHDVAVVMPTGGGKSLCYQLPAIVSGRLCVVVSPLIALMQDQASQLAQLGVSAAVLNSSQEQEDRKEVFRKLYRNELKLLYLSPERLAVPSTTEWLTRPTPTRAMATTTSTAPTAIAVVRIFLFRPATHNTTIAVITGTIAVPRSDTTTRAARTEMARPACASGRRPLIT